MSTINCQAKHCAYQPPDNHWRCPNCGDSENFYIEEPDSSCVEDCPLVHEKDEVVCAKCMSSFSGKQVCKKLAKMDGVTHVKCPHCKGTGYIRNDEHYRAEMNRLAKEWKETDTYKQTVGEE